MEFAMSEYNDADHIDDDDLEKAWPKEYTRVKGQDKGKGTSSKKQYALMQAAAAGKVKDISPEDAKDYLKNSPKGGEGLPEQGSGGARGERERSRAAKKAANKDKIDKADNAEQIKEKYRDKTISEEERIKQIKNKNRPKVVSFAEQIQNIKEKYKEKKPRKFETQVSDIKAKYNPLDKSRDLFYAKIEGALNKGNANERLISNMMDMDAYIISDDTSRIELYKTADKYFDAILSKEEQVVYELSYLAKNGCEDSHDLLVKFLDSMYDELVKHSSYEDVITSGIAYSMEKNKYKDNIKGGLADEKKPKEFDKKQLQDGIKIEYEHTNDMKIAREIAMDHLTEDPDYYKKLKLMEDGELDDDVEKSNYGPKGMGLYSEKDNINRKSRRVGTVHEDVGQNKSEYKYTPSARGTFAEQTKREAKRDKALSAKNPVKVYTDEEKKKLQEEYENKDKKSASEDNSRVIGKRGGESVRRVHAYERYTSGPNRGKYVHRVDAEKRLGRKLRTDEHVDHVSGNRKDNSSENLKVKSRSEHSADTNRERAKTKNGTVSGGKKVEHTGSH